jgi:hypothetical protein
MSSLPSSSATAQQNDGPCAVEDPVDPDASDAIKEAKAPEPLVPNAVVLNTSTARNFSTTRGRVYVRQLYIPLDTLTT